MLDVSQKYLIALSKAAVFDELPPDPPEGTDWEYIYKKSSEQNISGLIASAVLRLPEDKQPENADMWNEVMLQTMYVMSRKFAEFERMYDVLEKNGIVPICLKGIAVKELYPVPELRTMGDFDVLVEKEQRKKAEMLFEKEGYKVITDTLYFEASKGSVRWEVFFSLENEFRVNSEYYDDMLRQKTTLCNGRFIRPSNGYFAAHLLVHAAKHIANKGAGIRYLCDAAAVLKYYDIDWSLIKKICAEQGFLNISEYIAACVGKYYNLTVQYDISLNTDRFLEYMLCYGVFGKTENNNALLYHVAKDRMDISPLRKIFFPPAGLISNKYQFLKKYPFLVPFAWVHRVFEAKRRWGYSIPDMFKSLRGAFAYSAEREKWREELGLKDIKGDK